MGKKSICFGGDWVKQLIPGCFHAGCLYWQPQTPVLSDGRVSRKGDQREAVPGAATRGQASVGATASSLGGRALTFSELKRREAMEYRGGRGKDGPNFCLPPRCIQYHSHMLILFVDRTWMPDAPGFCSSGWLGELVAELFSLITKRTTAVADQALALPKGPSQEFHFGALPRLILPPLHRGYAVTLQGCRCAD